MPDVDGALAELALAVDELGCDGVTVETNAGGRCLGDPAFDPLWTEPALPEGTTWRELTTADCGRLFPRLVSAADVLDISRGRRRS